MKFKTNQYFSLTNIVKNKNFGTILPYQIISGLENNSSTSIYIKVTSLEHHGIS